jgi:hypothetical protein
MPNSVVVVVAGDDKTGEVFNAVKKHMDETKAKAKETSEALGEIGEHLKRGLEIAGIAVTIKEGISQLKEAVTQAAEFGETIAKAGERTGIAAGTLSVLHYAAAVTSTDFDKLVTASGKMGKNLADAADGNKKLSAAFQRIGIDAREIVNRHDALDIVMQHLAKTMAETESPARRLQLAGDLLGKQGQANIPVLMNLAEHFDELKGKAQAAGVYLNEMSAKDLQELNAKMKDLEQRVKGAKVAFAEGLAPALSDIYDEFKRASGGADIWKESGKNAGLLALGLTGAFQQVSSAVRAAYDDLLIFAAEVDKIIHYTPRFLIPEDQRKAYDEHQGYADQTIKDARREHDAILTEERHFNNRILAMQNQIMHPEQQSRVQSLVQYLRTMNEAGGGGDSKGGKGGSVLGTAKDGKAFVVNTQKLEEEALKEHADFLDKIEALNRSMHPPTLYGPDDYAKMAAMQTVSPDVSATIPEIPLEQLALKPLQKDYSALLGAGEKLGHAVFDPLFDLSMSWDNKWKATKDALLRDIGQLAESQLFKMLFGDPEGRGGQGLGGGSFEGNTANPRAGVLGASTGLLGGLLGHFLNRGAGVTSNGGVGGGAGTVATAAASAMQMGKTAAGGGGVQVVLNNNGAPLQVDSTQHSADGGEGQVVQIVLKQLETNGPVAQGIMGMLGAL